MIRNPSRPKRKSQMVWVTNDNGNTSVDKPLRIFIKNDFLLFLHNPMRFHLGHTSQRIFIHIYSHLRVYVLNFRTERFSLKKMKSY